MDTIFPNGITYSVLHNNFEQPSYSDMFQLIAKTRDAFFISQQKNDADLSESEKIKILSDLYEKKPVLFLQRYYKILTPEFLHLFVNDDEISKFYYGLIQKKKKPSKSGINKTVRNRRYLAMLELRKKGVYFSNEKMRERDPYLFDIMLGKYLNDVDQFNLRPTIECEKTTCEFTRLLEQFDDTQRISDRRKKYVFDNNNYTEKDDYISNSSRSDIMDRFLSHVNSRIIEADDELITQAFNECDDRNFGELPMNKHCATNEPTIMKNFKNRKAAETCVEDFLSLSVSNSRKHDCDSGSDSSGDEHDMLPTGVTLDKVNAEFVSIMEQRFLDGKDVEFFDYSKIDDEDVICKSVNKIQEQDLEDAYFDDEEPS